MSGLSRSVTTAQRGRSFTGVPVSGAATPAARRPEAVTVLYPGASVQQRRAAESGRRRVRGLDREAGMATAEYAIATLAAVAFAALLVAVLGSGEVRSLLMGLIRNALTLG